MNLSDARIVLRPRSLGETLDLALRWQASVGGGLYLRLWALCMLPAAVGCWAAQEFLDWEWPAVWTLAVGLATLLQGVFTVAASRLMFERDVATVSVLDQFLRRLPVYLLALFISRLYLFVGALLVVLIPWAWAHVAFVHEALLLEGQGAVAGVKRAGNFASGHHGRVIVMLMCQGLALCAFVMGADQVGYALFDFVLQIGRPFGELWEDGGSLFALLGFFGAVPYLVTVRFLQYIDARTRTDGWDIQLTFLARVVADREDSPGEAA